MDIAAIKKAKDEELRELGLVHRGDILAVRAFVEKGLSSETAEKKRSLLQSLKDKFSADRTGKNAKKRKASSSRTGTTGKEPSKKSVATTRKVYAGWQHYDRRQKRYMSVRLINGGGMRNIDIPIEATKAEIINQLKAVFFPDGTCIFGKTFEMQFTLGNFKCEEVSEENFTLSGYIHRNRLTKCRLYLLSKLYEDMISSDSDSEDLQLFVNSMSSGVSKGKHLTGESSSSVFSEGKPKCSEATGSSSQVTTFEDDLADVNHKDSSQEITFQDEMNSVDRSDDMVLKLRAAIVPDEPSESDEEIVTVSVRHVSLGVQKRRFSNSNQISAVYDWVGSLAIQPRTFRLSTCDVVHLIPSMPITLVDKCLIQMVEAPEHALTIADSGFIIPIPDESPPAILLASEDM